jgi:hypothetical protein
MNPFLVIYLAITFITLVLLCILAFGTTVKFTRGQFIAFVVASFFPIFNILMMLMFTGLALEEMKKRENSFLGKLGDWLEQPVKKHD